MQVAEANLANPDLSACGPTPAGGLIIYRSGMNEKIHRNFEVFPPEADPPPEDSPCDFIATITQHIPDKSFQLVRYYGWYSNKMRGQRDKQAVEEAQAAAGTAVEVIDVSEYKSRRIPLAKWRELIKKVWEADPLLCPKCSREMRIVALIDDRKVIARILRHLGLWSQGVRVLPARALPEIVDRVIPPSPLGYGGQAEHWIDDLPAVSATQSLQAGPFPDYDTEPVYLSFEALA